MTLRDLLLIVASASPVAGRASGGDVARALEVLLAVDLARWA